MSNYVRRPDDHIHAGLALHAGILLDQYDGLTANLSSNDKHEATLTLALLQMLLTNLMELFERLERDNASLFSAVIGDAALWGLEQAYIQQNTFPKPVRLGQVLRHLRNAVSHPTASTKTEWPDTGYTTPHGSDLANAFRFTHSPWVEDGKAPSFPTMRALKRSRDGLKQFGSKDDDSFQLDTRWQADGSVVVTRDGESAPYAPIFTIEIPLNALRRFTDELASFLAQPVDEHWDCVTSRALGDLLLIAQEGTGSLDPRPR